MSSDHNYPKKTFADLLNFHIGRGTRSNGSTVSSGKAWDLVELADALKDNERNIRNWRAGQNIPPRRRRRAIEALFFGDNASFDDWRIEFRAAGERKPMEALGLGAARPSSRVLRRKHGGSHARSGHRSERVPLASPQTPSAR